MSTFKDSSRAAWNSTNTVDHINAGSLQRIADATEKIAENYDALVRAKKSAEESRDYHQKCAARLRNQVAGLRGYINRLKSK